MLVWWALTLVMLDWHLGMLETADGRARPLGAADALTLARVWLVPAVLENPGPALCAAGFVTDALDGVAARSLGEPTRAGRDLEGLADACFAAALLTGLRRRGAIGPAASAAELARLGAGFSYSLAVYFGRAEAPDRELTRAARPTTVVRAAGLMSAAAGRRKLGTALVASGCAASVALLGRELSRGRA
jgi:phosphatidylglycerophosphate synthase